MAKKLEIEERLAITTCDVMLQSGHFRALGSEAMDTQAKALLDYHRAITTRTVAAYATSVAFAAISAALIVLAPESRTMAANLIAAAFLVLAVGIAGFTRFKAKAPAMEIEADGRNSN
jgi:hypothetical protein